MDHPALLQAIVLEVQQLKELIQHPIEERRLYSIKEICERTRLCERSIQYGIADGRYKPYRHGRMLRLDLTQVLEAMRQEGGA